MERAIPRETRGRADGMGLRVLWGCGSYQVYRVHVHAEVDGR